MGAGGQSCSGTGESLRLPEMLPRRDAGPAGSSLPEMTCGLASGDVVTRACPVAAQSMFSVCVKKLQNCPDSTE